MACPDCFRGTEHVGNPTGTIETIHGFKTYVAKPKDGVAPKGLIVFFPDAFGIDLVNNKILADHYATRGEYLVYLPDVMAGKPLPIKTMSIMEKISKPSSWLSTIFYKPFYVLRAISLFVPWLFTVRASVVRPRIIGFLTSIRTSPPPFPTSNLKIGAAGFCWGGQWAIRLAANTPSSRVARHASQQTTGIEPLIDCAFTAHPSFVNVPADIDAVTLPLSVSVGNEDMAMKGKLILQMKDILEVKKKGDHEVVILPGARHGFAIRSEPSDTYQMECAEKAEAQAVAWFARWLK